MPANTSPIFGLTPKTQGTQFVLADSTGAKTIYTAGASGSRILSIFAQTSDTAVNNVGLNIQVAGSGTAFPIGGKQVTALAGLLASPPTADINLLDPTQLLGLLPDGSLQLGALDVLSAQVLAAVTTNKTLTIVVIAIDY